LFNSGVTNFTNVCYLALPIFIVNKNPPDAKLLKQILHYDNVVPEVLLSSLEMTAIPRTAKYQYIK